MDFLPGKAGSIGHGSEYPVDMKRRFLLGAIQPGCDMRPLIDWDGVFRREQIDYLSIVGDLEGPADVSALDVSKPDALRVKIPHPGVLVQRHVPVGRRLDPSLDGQVRQRQVQVIGLLTGRGIHDADVWIVRTEFPVSIKVNRHVPLVPAPDDGRHVRTQRRVVENHPILHVRRIIGHIRFCDFVKKIDHFAMDLGIRASAGKHGHGQTQFKE